MKSRVNPLAGEILLRAGLFAGGAGLGVAAIRRLMRLRAEQSNADRSRDANASKVRIFQNGKLSADKQSGAVTDSANVAYQTLKNRFEKMTSSLGDSVRAGLSGSEALHPHEKPWFLPAVAALTAGGLGLGYMAGDATIKDIRDASANAELARARREYEEALREEHEGFKRSNERGELAQQFDRIINCLNRNGVKVAAGNPSPELSRTIGLLAGILLTGAGGAAAVGAYNGWNSAKSKSKQKAVQRARKERMNQQQAYTPTPIVVGQAFK